MSALGPEATPRWMLVSWVEAGGDVGGSQVGESWSVRYRLTVEPDDGLVAIVDDYWFADADPDDKEAPLAVSNMTSYVLCTDPSDPGGTEVWSDIGYKDGTIEYPTAEAAEAAARRSAEQANARDIVWDGRGRSRQ